MELKNKKWTDEEFFKVRKEVLNQWPTGKEVDLEEAVEYLKNVPEHKSFPAKLRKAKEAGSNTSTTKSRSCFN